jgi:putative ABC transport system permease protein
MWTDVRDAARSIRTRPTASLTVVVVLGSAIAVATVLCSLFAAVVTQVPPVDAPESLVHVWRADASRPAGHREPTTAEFLGWKADARSVTALTATKQEEVLVGAPEGRNVLALHVTSEYFALARRTPQRGRAFSEADYVRDAAVIISDALWRERFQSDPAVVGRLLHVDAAPREIVGVMPQEFWFPSPGVQVWLPYRTNVPIDVIDISGRLAGGSTIAQAQAEFDLLVRRTSGATASPDMRALVRTFSDESRIRLGPGITALITPAVVLLLIACANIANLLIIGMLSREREFATRAALGATPSALARLVMVETAMLSICGGLVGAALSAWGVRLLALRIAAANPALVGVVHLNRFVPAVAAMATALTMVATAAVPAWTAARRDVLPALSGAARASAKLRIGYGVGDVLIVLQVALGVALVVSTTMLARLPVELARQLKPAIDHEVYVTRLVARRELDRRHLGSVYETVLDSVKQSGGIAQAAFSSDVPGPSTRQVPILVASTAGTSDCRAAIVFVSRTYFDTLGLRLERGSLPASGEGAVVSASMARKCWSQPSDEWRVRIKAAEHMADEWLPVAAVASDLQAPPPAGNAKLRGVGSGAETIWIPSRADQMGQVFLLLRPSLALSSSGIADAVDRASQSVAIGSLTRFEDAAEVQVRQASLVVGVFVGVGVLALVLAFIGVYAALSQSCSLRLRELGIRRALGATSPRLISTALSRDFPLVASGIVMGIVGTLWVTAVVWRDLVAFTAIDPRVWLTVCALLGLAAFLASIAPALRALRVDPIAVLRAD